jgi:hypothetical protein
VKQIPDTRYIPSKKIHTKAHHSQSSKLKIRKYQDQREKSDTSPIEENPDPMTADFPSGSMDISHVWW